MSAMRDGLVTRARAIMTELSELDRTKAGGLPNVNQAGGGATVDHNKYKMSLYDELDRIIKLLGLQTLDQLESLLAGADPNVFEYETQQVP